METFTVDEDTLDVVFSKMRIEELSSEPPMPFDGFMESKRKELVIFDLNKVVCDRSRGKYVKYYDTADFISKISKRYRFAVWSSTTPKNAGPIVTRVFGDVEERMEFIWFRDKCVPVPRTHFDTTKPLEKVFTDPAFEGRWNEYNVVMIDDSPQKMVDNDPANVILVDPETEPNYVELLTKLDDRFRSLSRNV